MRTHDATLHNVIANHPEVLKSLDWKAEDHPETGGFLLFDGMADDPQTFLLHGGNREFTAADMLDPTVELPGVAMIFCWSAPGVFEAHTLAHPDRRQNTLGEAKALIHEMFTLHGAEMIWGQPASKNTRACRFFEKLGGKIVGDAEHPLVGPITYYANEKEEWLRDHWTRTE